MVHNTSKKCILKLEKGRIRNCLSVYIKANLEGANNNVNLVCTDFFPSALLLKLGGCLASGV